ncbi:MAG: lamin tail domain-containing protein [Bacteroidetes bacterium]|nr:lamin tail domain-containing protein [Bacteroidota bacterium]
MLKFLFGILFFSTSIVAVAQLQDDFNDGDFSNNPSWSGDAGDFAVSAAGQLQLNAAAAGESYLSLPFPVMGNGAVEWRFFIRENFSPSSGNYARVYLFLDSVNLENSGNGYYLQFGESLANDAVELFRQDSSSSISICRASDGQIASAFSLGVKVTRDEIGVWTLWLDPTGGTNYAPAASGAEGMYTPGGFFGIACTYTSGNRQNFFFDDFFVGPLMPDTLLPELSSLIATTDRNLEVRFTEIVDLVSGGVSGNYLVNQQVGMPANAWRDTLDLSLVHLDFNLPFPASTLLSLTVSGVKDLSGNAISPGSSGDFIYYPPIQAEHADVIFTEIMFEPSSGSILPNAEFVEVLNRRADAIPVKNWTLSDGSSTAVFPDQILLPGTYLILCAPDNTQAFASYGTVIGLNSFPGLNNDSGDQLELRDDHGRLIDKILFTNNTYHSDQ